MALMSWKKILPVGIFSSFFARLCTLYQIDYLKAIPHIKWVHATQDVDSSSPSDGCVVGVGVLVDGDDGEAVALPRAAHRRVPATAGRVTHACIMGTYLETCGVNLFSSLGCRECFPYRSDKNC